MGYKTTLCDVSLDGGHYGIAAPAVDFKPGLPAYLRITDINDDGTLNPSDRKSVDDSSAGNYLLHEGDIVFARTGNSTGRNYYYDPRDGEYAYAGFLIKFSLDPRKINPRYMKYYAQSKQYWDWVSSFNTGSTRGNINAKTYASMPIDLLSRQIQDGIVAICDAIDDKIRINRQLNDYLLEVGEMRFADLETRGTLSKTVHIADLPHILETGKRPKGGAASCGIPSVGAENVKKLGEFNYSSNKYIPRTFADNLKKGRVNGYELMIYKDGGRPGQFIPHFSMFGEGYPYKEFYINEHVFKLDFGDRGLNEFAYYYFHTPYVMKWLETNGTKAAIPGINRQNIEELEFPDPEQESVQDFCKRIQPYFTAIFRNCLENKQLQSLRDTLLPRLMSGEIDVSKVDLTQLTNNHLADY